MRITDPLPRPAPAALLLTLPQVLLAACSAPSPGGPSARGVPAREAPLEAPEPQPYRIGPGDDLEIHFAHDPDLTLTMPVRPDGLISLPFAQGVTAAGKTPEALATELQAMYSERPEDTGPYLIEPGDELELRFFHAPELDAVMPVRPDGLISLPFAGGVQAAGKTPEALAADLQRLYSEEPEEPAPYTIQRGDELQITFFHTPDLNLNLPVQPDGLISLPYAGGVSAAGKTPAALASELKQVYANQLKDPEIAVIVRTFSRPAIRLGGEEPGKPAVAVIVRSFANGSGRAGGRGPERAEIAVIVQNFGQLQIHVGGEVKKPGLFPIHGTKTVLEAVFEAGGLLDTAYTEEVVILRASPSSGYEVLVVDLDAVLSGEDTGQNVELLPRDAVYVPKSAIANFNTWVNLYIQNNIPVRLGFTKRF